MLKYKGLYHLLQEDQKELNKSYYKVLERNKELTEFNQLLQESNRKIVERENVMPTYTFYDKDTDEQFDEKQGVGVREKNISKTIQT